MQAGLLLTFNLILFSKKRNEKESMVCLTPNPTLSPVYKVEIIIFFFFTEKELCKEKGVEDCTKNEKKAFLLFSLRQLRTS